ncbi:MAG: hypothetical protein AAF598_21610 [Bacteroidota bacterium]
MKTILLSMFICFLLPISQPEVAHVPENSKGDFLAGLEAGFKHTLDNIGDLQNATIEEVIQDAYKAVGQTGTVTIPTLNEMVQQASNSKTSIPIGSCFLDLVGNLGTATTYFEMIAAIVIYDQCLEGLGYAPKSPERQFVVTYKAAMDLLYNELQYYRKGEMVSEDFIPGWLECAAAILGGAGAGFVSGGGAGALYGGAHGMAVGALIGTMAGALLGGADHC